MLREVLHAGRPLDHDSVIRDSRIPLNPRPAFVLAQATTAAQGLASDHGGETNWNFIFQNCWRIRFDKILTIPVRPFQTSESS